MGNATYVVWALFGVLSSIPVSAEEAVTFELGLGATALHFPDYVGSDETRSTVWPFPYVRYIGERWRVDRQLVNRELFQQNHWRLDLSFSGSLPVDSEDNEARQNMPDLMPTLEVGPWLQYRFAESSHDYWRTDLAIRKATAIDLTDYQNAGYAAHWQIFYHHHWQRSSVVWELETSLAVVFGDERQHNYFYGVAPDLASGSRPTYHADAGYGGWRYSIGLTRRQGQLWSAVFLRYFDVRDAVFMDSPLIRTDHNFALGVAAAWIW